MFLNGSSFEKSIYDIYNQFTILNPLLFPSKKFIDSNYVVLGKNSWSSMAFNVSNGSVSKTIEAHSTKVIVDYKNQKDLAMRIRHHYIARSKSDYSNDLPLHNYHLNVVELSAEQKKLRKKSEMSSMASLLNSPTTSNPDFKFTESTVPKTKALLDFFEQVIDDRPIIYAYNTEAQHYLERMLKERGYTVGILNGKKTPEEKEMIQEKFNVGKLDTLIFNVARAINLPSSDRILFYDIPTMPQVTYQVQGRIDRNNYDQPKFYNFFMYLNSPEMFNLVRLACFREEHSSAFTGQKTDVYKQLVEQLDNYMDSNTLKDATEKLSESPEISESDFETYLADVTF